MAQHVLGHGEFSPRADGLCHEHSSTRHVSLADALKVPQHAGQLQGLDVRRPPIFNATVTGEIIGRARRAAACKISRRANHGDLHWPHHPNGNHVGRRPVVQSDPGVESLRHLHAVEIAVDVEFEQIARRIARAARTFGVTR